MQPRHDCRPRALLLMLPALMLTACATRLPPTPVQIPPPPAALMSPQTVTDWQDYSVRLRAWLQSARSAVSSWPTR